MAKTPEQALAAYDALYGIRKPDGTIRYIIDGDESQVAADLAEALRATLPTYGVVEYPQDRGTDALAGGRTVVKTGLATKAEAQDWISQTDPGGRRVLEVVVEPKP